MPPVALSQLLSNTLPLLLHNFHSEAAALPLEGISDTALLPESFLPPSEPEMHLQFQSQHKLSVTNL